MAKSLDWTLRLVDRLSGPAKGMSSALGGVESKLQGVNAAMGKLDKNGRLRDANGKFLDMGKAVGGVQKQIGKLDKNGRLRDATGKFLGMGKAADGVGGSVAKMGGGFSIAKGLAVNAIGAIAGKLAEVGAMGIGQLGAILQGGMDKAGIMGGLQLLTGGADQAAAAYGRAAAKARELGMNTLDAAKGIQGLLSRGFKMEGDTGALKTLTALRALKTISPNVNQDSVLLALGQVQSKGKLQMEELSGQLAESLNKGFILDEIAKAKGYKTRAEVEKAITAGLIDSETGLNAIFKSIERVGGGSLESIASKGKGSFNNMVERLMGLPGELGANLDLSGFFATGVASIDRIIEALSSPGAQKFFDSIFNTIGAGLMEDAVGAFEKIVGVLSSPGAIQFFEEMAFALGAGIEGFGSGFEAMGKAMGAMDSRGMENLPVIMEAIGYALGVAVASTIFFTKTIERLIAAGVVLSTWFNTAMVTVYEFATAMGSLVGGVVGSVGAMFELFGTLGETALSAASGLGSSIIDGIVSGIDAGLSSVVTAITNVATSAVSAAEEALGIASPSKVFTEIGKQTTAGMARGQEKGTGAVVASSGAMAASAAAAGRLVGASISNTTTSASNSNVNVGAVNVSGGGSDPRSTGRAVANELRGMAAAHG